MDTGYWSTGWLPFMKVLYVLAGSFLWSLVVLAWDGWKKPSETRTRIPWWAQHTSFMYACFTCIALIQLKIWFQEMHVPEYYYTVSNVSMPPGQGSEADWEKCRTAWQNEQTLSGYPSLIHFAFTAPIWVVGTVIVSAWNTMAHIRKASERDRESGHETLWRQRSRNLTIWIPQLPVVYNISGLFAVHSAVLRSVMGASDCMNKENVHDFDFQTALSFGDAYEGIALLLFASNTLYVLKARVDKLVDKAASVAQTLEEKAHLQEEEAESVDGRPSEVKRRVTVDMLTDIAKCDEYLQHITEKMAESTSDVATLGISYFSFTCILKAAPAVFALQARVMGYEDTYTQARLLTESMKPTIKGMGLLGSCIAIHNMISIEQALEKDFLHDYNPRAKFISVKIMVSIVFIQEIFLPIVFRLSEPRAQLLDATLRTLEFFVISLFNIAAWKCDEEWYSDDVTHLEPEKDMDVGRMRKAHTSSGCVLSCEASI